MSVGCQRDYHHDDLYTKNDEEHGRQTIVNKPSRFRQVIEPQLSFGPEVMACCDCYGRWPARTSWIYGHGSLLTLVYVDPSKSTPGLRIIDLPLGGSIRVCPLRKHMARADTRCGSRRMTYYLCIASLPQPVKHNNQQRLTIHPATIVTPNRGEGSLWSGNRLTISIIMYSRSI